MKKIIYFVLSIFSILMLFGCLSGNDHGQANKELMQQTIQPTAPPTNNNDIAKSEDLPSSTCKKSVPIIRVDVNGIISDVNITPPYDLQNQLQSGAKLSIPITVSGVSSVDLGQGYFMTVDLKTPTDNPWVGEGKSKTIGNATINPTSFYTVNCK